MPHRDAGATARHEPVQIAELIAKLARRIEALPEQLRADFDRACLLFDVQPPLLLKQRKDVGHD